MDDRYSPRMRRIERANKSRSPALNLVSLMDIFTILVFFLLVNTSSVQQTSGDLLKLPEARVDKPVAESLVIQVNKQSISVLGRKIADVSSVLETDAEYIPALLKELMYQAQRTAGAADMDSGKQPVRSITVMGDREIQFDLLKKVILSASRAHYGKVSLVVISAPLRKK